MKKIMILSFMLVMILGIMGNGVQAALSCNMSVQASKTELTKNEVFTVNVNLSNIQSEKGVIALQATLEYDKNSLELMEMEGKNGWETPKDNKTYNAANGKIAIDRDEPGNSAETVFSITFRVKESSKQNLLVSLRDIVVADGTKPAKISQTSQNLTVTDGAQNPVPQPDPDEPDVNPGDNNTTNTNNNGSIIGGNTNKNVTTNTAGKNVSTNGRLPKAGNNGVIFITIIGLIAIVAVIFFLKMRLLNKEMKS